MLPLWKNCFLAKENRHSLVILDKVAPHITSSLSQLAVERITSEHPRHPPMTHTIGVAPGIAPKPQKDEMKPGKSAFNSFMMRRQIPPKYFENINWSY